MRPRAEEVKGNIHLVIEFSNQDRIHGNGYKLLKLRFWTDMGRNWFTNRVVNDWNRLSGHVVSAESRSIALKKRLVECIWIGMRGGKGMWLTIPAEPVENMESVYSLVLTFQLSPYSNIPLTVRISRYVLFS